MIGDGPKGATGSSRYMLEQLAHDKYGIAYSGIEHAQGISGLRAVALQAEDGGPYVLPSHETVQDRSYPLSRSIFFYLNREPGKPLDPIQREFLRYVLSRDGQAVVEQMHLYLPLTKQALEEELKKLD
jgi:phosphate transport system substrate-binding protein